MHTDIVILDLFHASVFYLALKNGRLLFSFHNQPTGVVADELNVHLIKPQLHTNLPTVHHSESKTLYTLDYDQF